ncbi:MAG: hypothetical protein KBS76_01020 [Ruminococcus sp.]|nr:hypothetical protein [Candidatus Apopatosoma intestinale]
MLKTVFALLSFLIAAVAFGIGAVRILRGKKPLYFKLLVCAAGCYAIAGLSSLIGLWCEVTESVSVGMLGIFGCNFFLLSANFGTLDKIVDDGNGSEKARALAVIAPVVMAAAAVFAFLAWKENDAFCAVVWVVMLLPALPASYYNLKHILLPTDPFGFLPATKPCNIAALVFYGTTAASVIGSALGSELAAGILSAFPSLAVLGLTVAADKGAKRWGI